MNYILIFKAICLIFMIDLTSSIVTPQKLVSSTKDIQTLMDAYNRKDYVEVWIKLIDLKLNLDPPDVHSKEMVQLLILRRRLEKYHKYYLLLYPSRKAPSSSQSTSAPIDINDENVVKQIDDILQVFNFIQKESNSLIGDDVQEQLLGILSDESKLDNVDANSSFGQLLDIFGSVAISAVAASEAAFNGNDNNIVPVSVTPPLLGSYSNMVTFSEETNEAISDAMHQIGEIGTSTITITTVPNAVAEESIKQENPIEEILNVFSIFGFV